MSYDESLAENLRKLLQNSKVTENKIFGGLAFMVNGNMCISVNNRPDHIMMVRLDPKDKSVFKKEGAKTAIMRGREMPGWFFLTEVAVKTQKKSGILGK